MGEQPNEGLRTGPLRDIKVLDFSIALTGPYATALMADQGAHVVKAFNTIFGGVLAEDKPLDAFFAGDSAEAKARVAAFLESLDMRPLDVGGLAMAYVLEWASILLMGLARNGAGFDVALGAEVH